MKRRFWILFALLLFSGGFALAQTVQFGTHQVLPEQNLKKLRTQPLRGGKTPTLQQLNPAFVTGTNYTLLQFENIPTSKERALLEKSGVSLLDYMGGNAYFASMPGTVNLAKVAAANANSVMPIAPEWKISENLLSETPDWTKGSYGKLKTTLHYFPVEQKFVKGELAKLGFHPSSFSEMVRSCDIELTEKEIVTLSALPWVEAITMVGAPQELYNYKSRVINRSNVLQIPNALGGRGLNGEGVRFGIWDGSVDRHIDFGNRLTIEEFELTVRSSGSHGVHVAGTVAGGGILDPLAQGMAPKAKFWSYNFNRQSNGKTEGEEMLDAFKEHGISLTQNSYGPSLDNLCRYFYQLVYDITKADFAMDKLAITAPTLTLVYASGNDQGACGGRYTYRSVARRAKNIMLIGAVDANARITSFSSCGPQDDGRLAPTVCAMGEDVWSSLSNNSYEFMSGTSMACPAASGTMVLLTQRYHQLHNGADPQSILLRALLANTADDAGRWGPDYVYGYGVINGKRAVEMMEQGNYLFGKPLKEKDAAHVYPLQIPAGTRRLRVMITWNDTVSMKANRRYGEPALINDLDLVVKKGDETFFPWVLDPNNPRRSATTGIDRINNIEQVLIEDPQPGLYNIQVMPSRVVSTGQEYVLTWFVEDKELELTYPLGGERFEPGDPIQVAWNKVYDSVSVDLSYDGGKTYTVMAEKIRNNVTEITIPADAPMTGNAKVRVRLNDKVSESPNTFSIMPVPKDVKLKSEYCSTTGWALSWEKVLGAEKYKVLKADVPNSEYHEIAEVTETSYALKPEHISSESANVFSVVAVGPNGVQSQRTPGQLAKVTTPLPKNETVLLNETFVRVPSQYIQLDSAHNTWGLEEYYREEKWSDYELGSHALIISAKQDADNSEWSDREADFPKSYEPTENNNAVRMRICNVDLTSFSKGKKVILAIEKRQRFRNSEKHSVFKVKIGDKDLQYMDIGNGVGTVALGAATGDTPSYYDLSEYVGQKFTIDMYYAARRAWVDQLYIDRVKIYVPEEKSDLQLKKLYLPESSSELGMETVSMLIINEGFKTVEGARVKCSVNGEAKGIYALEPLKPFERRKFTWPAQFDFSCRDPKGKKFEVQMEIISSSDIDSTNNKKSEPVLNFGNTYIQPFSQVFTGFLGTYPIDPLVVKKVEHSFIYTDNGGDGGDYPNHQSSTVHFVPSKKGNIIQITFYEYCSEYEDLLAVATKYKHTNLVITDDQYYEHIFRGDYNDPVTGKMKSPMTFTSKNEDGSIGCYFRANDDGYVNTGWVAEVREIVPTNVYTLTNLATDGLFHKDGKVPVVVTVKNNTDRELKNTRVAYSLDQEVWEYENIPTIAPNAEVVYTFKTPVNLPIAQKKTLYATLVSDDYITEDDNKKVAVLNDRYCGDRAYAQSGDCILSIVGQDGSWELHEIEPEDDDEEAYYLDHEYMIDSVFSMYRSDLHATLQLTTDKFYNPQSFSIRAWVDWNDDGDFLDEKESFVIPVKPNVTNYQLKIDIPPAASFGKKRLRIATSLTSDATDCGKLATSGNMVDLTIDLKDEPNPIQVDKKPSSIVVKDAVELTANEKVKVWITNCTAKEVEVGNVLLQVDDRLPILESSREVIKPFDSVEFEFKQRIDLSKVGAHNIAVSIEDENDNNESNNVLERKVYSVIPAKDGAYGLNFMGDTDRDEGLGCGTLDGENFVKDGMTFEAWINPRNSSLNNIYYKRGGLLVTLFDRKSQTIPPKTLVVLVNERRVFISDSGAVKMNKWQHLAVVYDPHKSKGEISVFINGEPITMKAQGSDTPQHDPKAPIWVAGAYEGWIDEVRLWNKVRKQEDVQKYMYKHAAGDFNYQTGLVAEYQLNEGPGNLLALNAAKEGSFAKIRTQRAADIDYPAWIETEQLISDLRSESFSRPAQIKGNDVTVWLRQKEDPAHVKITLESLWSKLSFTYKGNPVVADTEIDLSSGEAEILPKDFEIFGKKFDTPIKIKAIQDVAEPCDLLELSVLKSHNPRLTKDEVKNPVAQTEYLKLAGMTDYSAVRLNFKASEGATVSYLGMPLVAGETLVDLRQSATIKVLSENQQQAHYYVLRPLHNVAEFVAPAVPETMVFGETATLGFDAPVVLHTSDGNIVAVDGNKIRANGVGTAELTFVISRNGTTTETGKKVSVKVTPRAISVAPKAERVLFGHTVTSYELDYNYAVGAGERIMLNKFATEKVTYTLQYNGRDWDKTSPLPVGEHIWKPSNTTTFACGNYMVTPTTSKLTVKTTETLTVKFHVSDLANNNLRDAIVEINKLSGKTDADGNYSISLNTVDTTAYKYVISKDGYTTVASEWRNEKKESLVEVKLQKRDISLKYKAGENGAVEGGVDQMIPSGTTGEPVFASPAWGYRFEKWSDGKTDNPRIEKSVSRNVDVTASFVVSTPKVTYIAKEGGMVSDGIREATSLEINNPDGTKEIKAVAKSGYYFVRWSDGIDTPERADKQIYFDKTVEAIFTLARELPFTEDFDAFDSTPEGWLNIDNTGNAFWKITSNYVGRLGYIGSGNFAAINSQIVGPDKEVKVDLITPWIDLAKSEGDLKLTFDYKFEIIGLNVQPTEGFFVYYSTDGVTWKQIFRRYTDQLEGDKASIDIERAELKGAKSIRFKFHYCDTWGFAAIFDNVRVEAKKVKNFTVMYFAGEGGNLTVDGGVTLPMTQEFGKKGPKVTAVPERGYRFVKWTDGKTDVSREDTEFTYATAVFAKTASETIYTVEYRATTGGYIHGIALQKVNEGDATVYVDARPNFGYRFEKWDDNKAESGRHDVNVMSDLVRTAQFVAIPSYKVTFAKAEHGEYTITHNRGKKLENNTRCPEGDVLDLRPSPEAGYFTASVLVNGNTMPSRGGRYLIEVTSDTEIVVTFRPYEFTVTFVATNGGSLLGSTTQTVRAGQATSPVVATPDEGKEFLLWSNGSEDPTLTLKSVNRNMTYKAFFSELSWLQVTLCMNDGKDDRSVKTQKGKPFAESNPVRAGYAFQGWKTDRDLQKDFDVKGKIVTDTTLFASWKPISYSIAFDANGGSGEMEQLDAVYETMVALPANTFTAAGKTFAGWSLSASGEVMFYDGMQVKNLATVNGATTTLYAKWENGSVATHTLTFETNGGSIVAPQRVLTGKTAVEPVVPVKEGSAFLGWYTDAEFSTAYNFTSAVTADATLYARWAASVYIVRYNPGYGWGDMPDQPMEYGQYAELRQCAFKLSTYEFSGWATTLEGEGEYRDGARVKDLATQDGAVITLYATWAPIYHTISFETNGGGRMRAREVRDGRRIREPQAPAKKGFVFVAWFADPELTTPFDFNEPIMGNVTLYAAWRYEVAYFTLSIAEAVNGVISVLDIEGRPIEDGAELIPESKIQIFAKPNTADYRLRRLTVNGEKVRSGDTIVVTTNVHITADFTNPVEVAAFVDAKVAPNPFDNQFRILNTEALGVAEYELFNANGQLLRRDTLRETETIVETSDLPAGLYLLQLKNGDGGSRTIRIVKTR